MRSFFLVVSTPILQLFGKLAPYADFFQGLISQGPNITLFELRDALAGAHGEKVHHYGIAVMLKRLEYTHKKVVGRHRTQSSTRETQRRRLVQASYMCDCSKTRTCSRHKRNKCHNKPHVSARLGVVWASLRYECALWLLGALKL